MTDASSSPTSSPAPLIELRDVSRTLPLEVPVTLVRGVSLSIRPGELVSVTGPSGSGKSSLLYLMGLLDRPTGGEIFLDGRATGDLSESELGRLRLTRIGFVFQFHFLLAEFTALENVMLPMKRLGRLGPREREERGKTLLDDLGIADQAAKYPSQLSGGQRQRVAIARALANEPAAILADEPTGNLDSRNSKAVQDIFHHLAGSHGVAVVVVTHDAAFAAAADREICLVDGAIVSG